MRVCILSFQSCPTLCKAMDYSQPSSSVLGILQTSILKWVVLPSSKGSSQPRDWTCHSDFLHLQVGYYFFKLFVLIGDQLLYNIVVVFAIHWHESALCIHTFPILTPIHFPPRPTPQGHPSAPVLIILYHASNLDWRFLSHMIIYMFQCYSLRSSQARPLPQSPIDCSIHLCLLCCPTYRVIVTIFLNSLYMCEYTILVLFFLTSLTLYNRLQFHPLH